MVSLGLRRCENLRIETFPLSRLFLADPSLFSVRDYFFAKCLLVLRWGWFLWVGR